MKEVQPSRRQFNAMAAAAGLALGLPAARAQGQSLAPIGTEPIYFRGWPFKPEVVTDNVNRYNRELHGHVDYATLTHGDYPTLIEKSLIAHDKLDIIYANPPTAVRFLEAGWIQPADDVPAFKEAYADMYPNVREAWTYKGKMLGLSYFLSTRGMVMVNMKRQKELGLEKAEPKNWDEFYAQLLELAKKGAKDVYLPHWFNEFYGISWAFLWETSNRGGKVIDPATFAPQLSADGPAGKTLAAWKSIFNAKIVPEEVLSYNEPSIVEGFGSGRYLYSTQAAYQMAVFNDPTKSKIAGAVSFLPHRGQAWGLLDSALYLRTSRKRSSDGDEDARRFQSWYGYKDQNGKIAVGQRWAENSMLFSAYKTVMNSPETEAAYKKNLSRPEDYNALLDLYAQSLQPEVWKTVWAEEFNAFLRQRLGEFLLKNQPVADVIGAMNNKINELNRKYKMAK
ncbi:MAG: extracellular solute-binding protein [Burkholderiales bacterium]|nr:extracellular solute-binding protein [Burkholderiales bacterium]